MENKHVERQSRTLVHAGSIIDYYQDEMLLPNGKTEVWDFVSHRMGAACVVAVLPDGRLLLVRQYRPALERYTLELPAGCRDSLDEDPAITSARELEEETGYHANRLSHLLTLKTTVAFCNENIEVYLAEDLQPVGEQHLDDAESIDLVRLTLEEAFEKIYSYEIQDSKTVAGIMAYANLRK